MSGTVGSGITGSGSLTGGISGCGGGAGTSCGGEEASSCGMAAILGEVGNPGDRLDEEHDARDAEAREEPREELGVVRAIRVEVPREIALNLSDGGSRSGRGPSRICVALTSERTL